ncbi:glycerol 3-phosphate dehydrogenase (NAD(P)+) [Geothermobacter ehrlichii]|uniref:Glycerol-3-phosphate dehydrogenase [NAD(P)+] n=1 Tax=Geothermobacter ehrlichii TaxID=213224 RepID=A0A5D3WKK2_9BACT|nr:NAD(P)H-dependent glycerol-3-phosphate dehydrogenase [Geothermobacter ehrlichii]TYO97675.1 glycerol 3-phosphate dehydrogenase (NAD(P)+) [Geothermobacter ehrlichii]
MKIGVLGGGSWGTTLANLLAKSGHEVTLWLYERELAERLPRTRENDVYLPGVILNQNLAFTNSFDKAVSGCEMLLLVPPSQVLRQVFAEACRYLPGQAIVVSASKGIENDSLLLMSEVLEEVGPAGILERSAFLSGPSFAREVAAEMPTAVAVAALRPAVATRVQKAFSTDYFRVYTNSDIVGIELGGALKNVIALAAGVSDGLGFGHNTRAALITRGLAEITRLATAKGGQPATLAGLAGMGDLVLTCTGDLSRNRSVGVELGKGRSLSEILGGMQMVAEGVKTTLSAYQLARKLEIEAPIISQMYQILYEDKPARTAVIDLMQRDLKAE